MCKMLVDWTENPLCARSLMHGDWTLNYDHTKPLMYGDWTKIVMHGPRCNVIGQKNVMHTTTGRMILMHAR